MTMLLLEGYLDDEFIESDVTILTTNPYNNDMRNRMIEHAIKIKSIKDRCTTPVIVEFSSLLKSSDNTVNIAATHCKIFVVVKNLNSSVKLIN